MRRVVVTGAGAISAAGAGAEPLLEALRTGTPRPSELGDPLGHRRSGAARMAMLVGRTDTARWLPPAAARRMCAASRFAAVAARMAAADAGLEAPLGEAAGVYLGTAFGSVTVAEDLVRQIVLEGPDRASPLIFPESVANAPAAQAAIATGARGPNVTVTQREAGPMMALLQAADDVARGRVERALAGGVEEAGHLVHAILDRFAALAPPDAEGRELSRPFDARRRGFVMGEGAVVLVLEEESAARARGARLLARIRGGGRAFDPAAPSHGWGRDAAGLATGLHRALARAGVATGDLGAVVSGASGAVAGDRLEALVLRQAWGSLPLPRLWAPKAVTGEYGGGALAALVAAVSRGIGPTPGFEVEDPELRVAPTVQAFPPARRALGSALAAGGAAAWLVVESPAEP